MKKEPTTKQQPLPSSAGNANEDTRRRACLGQGGFRNWLEFRRNHLDFLHRVARECGDFAELKIGPQRVFLINDPRLIKEMLVTHHKDFKRGPGHQAMKRVVLGNGLLTSDGEFHRRQRRLAQPAFHKQRIAGYGETMTGHTARSVARWRDGSEIDLAKEMMDLSLSILTKTLIDADIGGEAKDIGADVHTVLLGSFGLLDSPWGFLAGRFGLPIPRSRKLRAAQKRLDHIIYQIINERRHTGEDRGDFISMLLMAQDQEANNAQMTDLQVRDEAMTILVAGQETIALAMTWTWYLLAKHADIRAKLLQEVDQVLAGRIPTVDDLPRLELARRILTESMRLYPPVWAVGRVALHDLTLGGHRVPKGSLVMVSPFVTQHDPRFFPNPERFDPDRWLETGKPEQQQKLAYFPFLTGPNRCIGEQYAWMEGVLAIATIAREWTLELGPGQLVEPQPMITLRPRYGMRMITRKRDMPVWQQ